MLFKGAKRGNAVQAGQYLLDLKDNDKTAVIEIRGTLSKDVQKAVLEMEAIASASRCREENRYYFVSANLAEGEHLTPEQWGRLWDVYEKEQGLSGNQRIIVEHHQEGREHQHAFYCRVDPEKLTAVPMRKDWVKNEKIAAQLNREFGFEHVQGRHIDENGEPIKDNEKRAERGPTHNETQQSKKSGVNLYKWRQEIRALAGIDATGAELIAALESKGHLVAHGNKVDFLILDPSGKPHRMAQSLGLKVKNLKERLEGIDPEKLPDVAAAQEKQKERLAEIERNNTTRRGAGMYDRGGLASQQADAVQHIKDKKHHLHAQTPEQHAKQQAEGEKARAIRKEKPAVPAQNQSQQEPPPLPAFSQRESLLRDIAPHLAKQVRTEQKDARREVTAAKQEKSAADVMREVFETNYSRKPSGGGRDPRDNDRERERER